MPATGLLHLASDVLRAISDFLVSEDQVWVETLRRRHEMDRAAKVPEATEMSL